jgi:hypothetical protein
VRIFRFSGVFSTPLRIAERVDLGKPTALRNAGLLDLKILVIGNRFMLGGMAVVVCVLRRVEGG